MRKLSLRLSNIVGARQLGRATGRSAPKAAKKAPTASSSQQVPASRAGKKTIAAHFEPIVSRQLKLIGLERDASMQALLREALNDLFVKYGKRPIA